MKIEWPGKDGKHPRYLPRGKMKNHRTIENVRPIKCSFVSINHLFLIFVHLWNIVIQSLIRTVSLRYQDLVIIFTAGYVYVLFECESSVKTLLQSCSVQSERDFNAPTTGEYYYKISSRRMRSKEVCTLCSMSQCCSIFDLLHITGNNGLKSFANISSNNVYVYQCIMSHEVLIKYKGNLGEFVIF